MEAGMRRLPFLATLVGVVLLATGLMVTAQAITQGREQQATLRRDAAQVAASFTSYFDRAHSLDLLLAQNQTFAVSSAGTIDRGAVNRALQYLQVLYPDAIGEACVIDEHGREVARVTQGTPAAAADLSSNEAQNPFFAPTLALGPGQVYQAAPYVSPDTHTWVISNSTWIRLPDSRRLIVHFEVALASFAKYVATSAAGRHVAGTIRGGHLVRPPGDLSDPCRARQRSPSDAAPHRPDRQQRQRLVRRGMDHCARQPAAHLVWPDRHRVGPAADRHRAGGVASPAEHPARGRAPGPPHRHGQPQGPGGGPRRGGRRR